MPFSRKGPTLTCMQEEDKSPSSPSNLLPVRFRHDPVNQVFARNITGRYRRAQVHPLSLSPSPRALHSSFWSSNPPFDTDLFAQDHDETPDTWHWQDTARLDMSFVETAPLGFNLTKASASEDPFYLWGAGDWNFLEGSLTLTSATPAFLPLWNIEDLVRYDFYGMHHIPNGTINLYALPRGKHISPVSSRIPDWGQGNMLDGLVMDLREKMDVKKQLAWYSHIWFNTPFDIEERGLKTECPLSIHMTLPPSADPATTNSTAPQADYHLSPPGLAGVAIAEGCGWALGFEGGEAKISPRPLITVREYLALTFSCLIVQLELSSQVGSKTALVFTSTIFMMIFSDCLMIMCIVGHGLRERALRRETIIIQICYGTQFVYTLVSLLIIHNRFCRTHYRDVRVIPSPFGLSLNLLRREEGAFRPWVFPIRSLISWLLVLLSVSWYTFPYLFHPRIFPFALFAMYSFWVPQISFSALCQRRHPWRKRAMFGITGIHIFLVLGSFGRDNDEMMTTGKKWAWIFAFWQVVQLCVLYLQTTRRPDFLYDYQPTTRPASLNKDDVFDCPICYETVHLPFPPASLGSASVQEMTGGLAAVKAGQGKQKARVVMGKEDSTLALGEEGGPDQKAVEKGDYAIAPCNHVYHKSCLKEAMKMSSVCPLCFSPWPFLD
ncbi:hypothetical protein IAR50_005032 [Cryptococcus sp. DSM 104548]